MTNSSVDSKKYKILHSKNIKRKIEKGSRQTTRDKEAFFKQLYFDETDLEALMLKPKP